LTCAAAILSAAALAPFAWAVPKPYGWEVAAMTSGNADGYYGWAEAAPFDRITVTCGTDHVPPPLLKQLRGGIMVIPVGLPGAQRLLKIVKEEEADGTIKVARSDIYGGRVVPFVPFTKFEGDTSKGTHNQR
jgi:protein-L-isoaspartate(D-aspartate) O-methyltransferase